MRTITRKQAEILIANSDKIFGVEFIKKDKSIRKMACRRGVQYTSETGRPQAYKPRERGYITVFDMRKKDYRLININTLRSLKVSGHKYQVQANETNQINPA